MVKHTTHAHFLQPDGMTAGTANHISKKMVETINELVGDKTTDILRSCCERSPSA